MWLGPRWWQKSDETLQGLPAVPPASVCSNSGQQTLSAKGQVVSIVGFSGHILSVTAQLCHCSSKEATGNT